MTIMRITIINPKAEKLLKDLEELDLIKIQDTANNEFAELLKRLRSKGKPPSLEEITKEVEIVRSERYARKAQESGSGR